MRTEWSDQALQPKRLERNLFGVRVITVQFQLAGTDNQLIGEGRVEHAGDIQGPRSAQVASGYVRGQFVRRGIPP